MGSRPGREQRSSLGVHCVGHLCRAPALPTWHSCSPNTLGAPPGRGGQGSCHLTAPGEGPLLPGEPAAERRDRPAPRRPLGPRVPRIECRKTHHAGAHGFCLRPPPRSACAWGERGCTPRAAGTERRHGGAVGRRIQAVLPSAQSGGSLRVSTKESGPPGGLWSRVEGPPSPAPRSATSSRVPGPPGGESELAACTLQGPGVAGGRGHTPRPSLSRAALPDGLGPWRAGSPHLSEEGASDNNLTGARPSETRGSAWRAPGRGDMGDGTGCWRVGCSPSPSPQCPCIWKWHSDFQDDQ